jgi:hypothetical protein
MVFVLKKNTVICASEVPLSPKRLGGAFNIPPQHAKKVRIISCFLVHFFKQRD